MPKGFPPGDPRAIAAAKKGAAASRATRRRKALERFYQAWPLMPHEAAVWILADRQRAYRAGWVAGRRERP